MRITGGILRGRRILVPKLDIRPTQEKVREALFSILGYRIYGSRFLDVYAGSGAVGIEAWSRGASYICWVESNAKTAKLMRSNIETLCKSAGKVAKVDAWKYLKECGEEHPFDIVFLDPPYECFTAMNENDGLSLGSRLLDSINSGNILVKGGIVLIEHPEGIAPIELNGWKGILDRRYGSTCVGFYERNIY